MNCKGQQIYGPTVFHAKKNPAPITHLQCLFWKPSLPDFHCSPLPCPFPVLMYIHILLELAEWKTETNVFKHLEGHYIRWSFPLSLSYSRREKEGYWNGVRFAFSFKKTFVTVWELCREEMAKVRGWGWGEALRQVHSVFYWREFSVEPRGSAHYSWEQEGAGGENEAFDL